MASKSKSAKNKQTNDEIDSVSSKKIETKTNKAELKTSKSEKAIKPRITSEVKDKLAHKDRKTPKTKKDQEKTLSVEKKEELVIKRGNNKNTPAPMKHKTDCKASKIEVTKKSPDEKVSAKAKSDKKTEDFETKSKSEINISDESPTKKSIKSEVTNKETKAKVKGIEKAKEKPQEQTKVVGEQHTTQKKGITEMPKPTVRYSDEDLEMFKAKILEVRKEAIEELGMLKERLEDLTNYDFAEESMIYSMHMAEQGSEAMEKEKTYAQIQRINEYIKKLDEALQRIADKTYGICRECGILIAKERLLAVPITTLSASWKIRKVCPEDGIDRIEPLK